MKNARRSPWRLLYKFHRYTGLSVGIIIVMLAITGIILNHTDDLQLNRQFVNSPAILDWYGIAAPELQNSFSIQQHWLTQSGQQIYLDAKPVYHTQKVLIGAIVNSEFIAAAFNDSLLLLTLDGKVIEYIDNKPIQKIGIGDKQSIYIENEGIISVSDDASLSWQISDESALLWSSSSSLPTELKNRLQVLSRNSILPYERVLLDIHSGRFFGSYGIYTAPVCLVRCVILVMYFSS